MATKKQEKTEGLSTEELVALAKEMNKVMGLDPAINLEDDAEGLEEEIRKEVGEIYPTDGFMEASKLSLRTLGIGPWLEPEEEPGEKPAEEPVPEEEPPEEGAGEEPPPEEPTSTPKKEEGGKGTVAKKKAAPKKKAKTAAKKAAPKKAKAAPEKAAPAEKKQKAEDLMKQLLKSKASEKDQVSAFAAYYKEKGKKVDTAFIKKRIGIYTKIVNG